MVLARIVEIGLFEDEGHSQNAFPEVDRGLPVRADERDMMNALRLQFPHRKLLLLRRAIMLCCGHVGVICCRQCSAVDRLWQLLSLLRSVHRPETIDRQST